MPLTPLDKDVMDFRNRVILVTGAASGIGRALCRQLGSAGARLGLVDRDKDGLKTCASEFDAAGVQTAQAVADVRKRDEVRAAVASVTERLGPVEVLIPCAGICGFEVVDDLNVPQVERILQINFLGVVYAIDAVLPGMLGRRSGRIVGIASLAGVRAIPFEPAYCASKAGLAAYLEALRPALRRRGILVTTVFPGFVRTPLLDGLLVAGQTRVPPDAIDADTCAANILRAVRRGRRVASFPRTTSWMVSVARLLPPGLYDRIMSRMAARINLPY
jgi:short-subunit dehydrogenase